MKAIVLALLLSGCASVPPMPYEWRVVTPLTLLQRCHIRAGACVPGYDPEKCIVLSSVSEDVAARVRDADDRMSLRDHELFIHCAGKRHGEET